ncbi:MAG: diguanylate cyclase [Proteobacteria bacterium]|nr:diguanylate cyclase [Pseudomonadota bacterium]MBU1711264.1 diguanylate cyclase [Pseudomonadota bacterium]
MKILIVEDDTELCKSLENALQKMGLSPLTAPNGLAALAILHKEQIDFVISDWIMPELDGIELCRAIRNQEGHDYIYFMLLTVKGEIIDIINAFAAGVDDYLAKPFVLDELESRIRAGERILNHYKNLQEENAKLELLIRIDPLLEIGNRRSFHEVIEKSHDRACRYQQSYGAIMCDLDFFKSYNDIYGHQSGDQILRKVATSIKDTSRTSDEVFRYGGEEIIVILPDQNLEKTQIVAQRITQSIEALNIEHKGADSGKLTVSCGVAAFDKECIGEKWVRVIERADQALYRAKSAGRNQVSI